jgi:hypothetical protein
VEEAEAEELCLKKRHLAQQEEENYWCHRDLSLLPFQLSFAVAVKDPGPPGVPDLLFVSVLLLLFFCGEGSGSIVLENSVLRLLFEEFCC